MVGDAAVAHARVGERRAQARDGNTVETGRGIEDRAELDAREPEARPRPDDAGTHDDDRGVGVGDVARDGERRVQRYRSRRKGSSAVPLLLSLRLVFWYSCPYLTTIRCDHFMV